MNNDTTEHLTGGYLLAEWEGAHKATGIGKRPWVRQQYPDLTYNQWWGRVYRYQQSIDNEKAEDPRPDLYVNVIEDEKTYTGDWMVVGDVHAPCTDYDMAQLIPAISEKYLPECQGLIIAGDLINADAWSKYASVIALPSWQEEIAAARHLLKIWFETFDKIVWLMGNHEIRKLVHDGGQTTVQELKDAILQSDKLDVTVLDRCFVDADNGKWLICHGGNYRQMQLSAASEYAQKYRAHVISHHEHHLAMGQSKYKWQTVVNNGGLFDPDKLAYVKLKTTTSPNMARGFSMLRGGYCYLFGEDHFTDWDYWLGGDT